MQTFKPDFAFTDLVLVGGQALADRLSIPKGIMYIPGLLEPIAGHSYGSGASLLSTVPVWMSLLPRHMVSPAFQLKDFSCQSSYRCLLAYFSENHSPLDTGSTAALHSCISLSWHLQQAADSKLHSGFRLIEQTTVVSCLCKMLTFAHLDVLQLIFHHLCVSNSNAPVVAASFLVVMSIGHVCLQNFIQRVQNFFGALMNYFVWCHIIENEMDKQYW